MKKTNSRTIWPAPVTLIQTLCLRSFGCQSCSTCYYSTNAVRYVPAPPMRTLIYEQITASSCRNSKLVIYSLPQLRPQHEGEFQPEISTSFMCLLNVKSVRFSHQCYSCFSEQSVIFCWWNELRASCGKQTSDLFRIFSLFLLLEDIVRSPWFSGFPSQSMPRRVCCRVTGAAEA